MSGADDSIPLPAWQVEEIKRGLAEADAGDFASEEEVETLFAKWRGAKRRPDSP